MSDIQLANAIVVLNFTVNLYATMRRRHEVPTSFKAMLHSLSFADMVCVGEGKRRNEFAEWHVAWVYSYYGLSTLHL